MQSMRIGVEAWSDINSDPDLAEADAAGYNAASPEQPGFIHAATSPNHRVLPSYLRNRFALITHVVAGCRPHIPDSCSLELRRVVQACWAQEPDQRPSAAELVSMLDSLAASSGELR